MVLTKEWSAASRQRVVSTSRGEVERVESGVRLRRTDEEEIRLRRISNQLNVTAQISHKRFLQCHNCSCHLPLSGIANSPHMNSPEANSCASSPRSGWPYMTLSKTKSCPLSTLCRFAADHAHLSCPLRETDHSFYKLLTNRFKCDKI